MLLRLAVDQLEITAIKTLFYFVKPHCQKIILDTSDLELAVNE